MSVRIGSCSGDVGINEDREVVHGVVGVVLSSSQALKRYDTANVSLRELCYHYRD